MNNTYSNKNTFHDFLILKKNFEHFCKKYLEKQNIPSKILLDAMNYTLLGSAKRIRPLLSYIFGKSFLILSNQDLNLIAFAIESIHTYSLVHDDLPCMDDANLRRGKESCHIKFDYATAVLVGDALQSIAFEAISELNCTYSGKIKKMLKCLSTNIGARNMISGQQLDIEIHKKSITTNYLDELYLYKTSKLLESSIMLPFYLSDFYTDKNLEENLIYFSKILGIAFQIKDDILDVTSNKEYLGKNVGNDKKLKKKTYPEVLGIEFSKKRLSILVNKLEQYIHKFNFNNTKELLKIIKYIFD